MRNNKTKVGNSDNDVHFFTMVCSQNHTKLTFRFDVDIKSLCYPNLSSLTGKPTTEVVTSVKQVV